MQMAATESSVASNEALVQIAGKFEPLRVLQLTCVKITSE
jgi:hypothetical protein